MNSFVMFTTQTVGDGAQMVDLRRTQSHMHLSSYYEFDELNTVAIALVGRK